MQRPGCFIQKERYLNDKDGAVERMDGEETCDSAPLKVTADHRAPIGLLCAGALWVSIGGFCTFHFISDRGLIRGGMYSLPVVVLPAALIMGCRWLSALAAGLCVRGGRRPSSRRWAFNALLVFCVALGVAAVGIGEDYMRAGLAASQARANGPGDGSPIDIVQPVWVYYRLAIAGGLLQAAVVIVGTALLHRKEPPRPSLPS
jgi:hypothetical protein